MVSRAALGAMLGGWGGDTLVTTDGLGGGAVTAVGGAAVAARLGGLMDIPVGGAAVATGLGGLTEVPASVDAVGGLAVMLLVGPGA